MSQLRRPFVARSSSAWAWDEARWSEAGARYSHPHGHLWAPVILGHRGLRLRRGRQPGGRLHDRHAPRVPRPGRHARAGRRVGDRSGDQHAGHRDATRHPGTDLGDAITQGNDEIRVGAGGQVNLGFSHFGGLDQDVDVTTSTAPRKAFLYGGSGDDFLTGGGDELTHNPGPATFHIYAQGEAGNDHGNGGRGRDELFGGPGADRYLSVDAHRDTVTDFGTDLSVDFADVDSLDTPVTGIEQRITEPPTAP